MPRPSRLITAVFVGLVLTWTLSAARHSDDARTTTADAVSAGVKEFPPATAEAREVVRVASATPLSPTEVRVLSAMLALAATVGCAIRCGRGAGISNGDLVPATRRLGRSTPSRAPPSGWSSSGRSFALPTIAMQR